MPKTPPDYLRRKQKPPFSLVSDHLWYFHPVSPIARLVYVYLCYRAKDQPTAFPSYWTMAYDLDVQRNTIIHAIKELLELGLIEKEERYTQVGDRTSNLYTICEPPVPPEWAFENPELWRRTQWKGGRKGDQTGSANFAPPPGVGNALPRGAKTAPPPGADSTLPRRTERTTPEQDSPHPVVAETVETEAVSTLPGSDAVPNNKHLRMIQGTPPARSVGAASFNSHSTELDDVQRALVEFGITRRVASRLAETHGQHCMEVLTWARLAPAGEIDNPPGWVRVALEEEWAAPPWSSRPQRVERPRYMARCPNPACGHAWVYSGDPIRIVDCVDCHTTFETTGELFSAGPS
jgi:hypothetical protein